VPTTHDVGFTIRDYSDEVSNFKVNIGATTALNIAGVLAQIGNLRNAVDNIILGVIASDRWTADNNTYSNATPGDTTAQVELKWLVRVEANTSKKVFRHEIATPDLSKLVPGSDKADITDSAIAAYISAYEAIGKSPDNDAEGMNVLDITLVGRNR